MGTINVVKNIKLVHPSCVVIVKIGTFYNVYGKDSFITSYLLGYKIKEKDNIPACSFPVSSLNKIENVLEKNKINYIVVDKRSNYEVEHKQINKQENNYDKIFDYSTLIATRTVTNNQNFKKISTLLLTLLKLVV